MHHAFPSECQSRLADVVEYPQPSAHEIVVLLGMVSDTLTRCVDDWSPFNWKRARVLDKFKLTTGNPEHGSSLRADGRAHQHYLFDPPEQRLLRVSRWAQWIESHTAHGADRCIRVCLTDNPLIHRLHRAQSLQLPLHVA